MDNTTPYDGIDIDKAIAVLRKSIIWILLIFLFTNLAAYLVIRYTKPLYESESELKLDVETNASELGLTTFGEGKNLNIISGEIELIKSKLFFNKVIDNFDLWVSYYTAGDVLDDEKYKVSPFVVDYTLKTPRLMDQKLEIEFIDNNSFVLKLAASQSMEYKFGQKITTEDIELVVNKTQYFKPGPERYHYFKINSRNSLVSYLENNLTVVPLNLNANTIKVSFQDYNATKARDLVNAIDSIYLNYSQEEKNQENRQKILWLNSELTNIETQLEGFEDYFENFTIENRTNDLDADLENTIKFINQIDSQRFEVSKKLNLSSALLADLEVEGAGMNLQNSIHKFPKEVEESITRLIEQLQAYEDLKLTYTESTFALRRKENEIKIIKNTLTNQVRALVANYDEQLTALNQQKVQLQKNFVELPGKSTEFNKKQRFFKLYEEFYLSLMQSKAEYQIAQAGTTTDFKILSAATLASAPISPDKLIIHGIGFVAGFVFSFFFVGIRYLLHNKVSTPSELEKLTNAPILGHIPQDNSKMENSILMVDQKPKSAVSESLRSIRTNLDFITSKGKQRIISVTSTISGEGKTFIAVNLGAIIALSKKKVIVLDLDMRKPRVHMSFETENTSKGISTILIDKHSIEECINHSRIENLDFINAGPTPPNPSELLLNGEFDTLIERLKLSYDIIILDTPPVGLVTDGILAMKKADLAMYVVRANYSKREFLKTLNRLISVNQFKNLAVVLNALPNLRSNYGYGYGYYENQPAERTSVLGKLMKR